MYLTPIVGDFGPLTKQLISETKTCRELFAFRGVGVNDEALIYDLIDPKTTVGRIFVGGVTVKKMVLAL